MPSAQKALDILRKNFDLETVFFYDDTLPDHDYNRAATISHLLIAIIFYIYDLFDLAREQLKIALNHNEKAFDKFLWKQINLLNITMLKIEKNEPIPIFGTKEDFRHLAEIILSDLADYEAQKKLTLSIWFKEFIYASLNIDYDELVRLHKE